MSDKGSKDGLLEQTSTLSKSTRSGCLHGSVINLQDTDSLYTYRLDANEIKGVVWVNRVYKKVPVCLLVAVLYVSFRTMSLSYVGFTMYEDIYQPMYVFTLITC